MGGFGAGSNGMGGFGAASNFAGNFGTGMTNYGGLGLGNGVAASQNTAFVNQIGTHAGINKMNKYCSQH